MSYKNFDELFDAFNAAGAIEVFKNDQVRQIEKLRYDHCFTYWLQQTKGLEYGNIDQYNNFLTKSNFADFLKDEQAEKEVYRFMDSFSNPKAYLVFQEEFSKLEWQFKIKKKATAEDCRDIPNLKEGDIIEYDSLYNTNKEAYDFLSNYFAKSYLELEKWQFIEKYKLWNKDTIEAEILEIEKFRDQTDSLSLSEACKAFDSFDGDKPEFIYKRLKSGFYSNLEIEKYPLIGVIGNIECRIYSRYFLFYNFLINELQKHLPFDFSKEHDEPQPQRLITTTDKIIRELDIIQRIFEAQYSVIDTTNFLPYPMLLNEDGTEQVPGRYIASGHFYSTHELFCIQHYKDEITRRYEQTTNTSLIINQLVEIYKLAVRNRDYFNDNLTNQNQIFKQFLKDREKSYEEEQRTLKYHSAVITVSDYYIGEIYFGIEFHKFKRDDKYNFNYIFYNKTLAHICQSLIDFIDKFEIANISMDINELALLNKNNVAFIPLSLVKSEMHNLMFDFENTISEKIKNWKIGNDKTGCAVFCIFLYHKKYFLVNELKTAKQFAKMRYGIDCSIMIDKLRKANKKTDLDNKLTDLTRVLFNKPYGKL